MAQGRDVLASIFTRSAPPARRLPVVSSARGRSLRRGCGEGPQWSASDSSNRAAASAAAGPGGVTPRVRDAKGFPTLC